MIIDLNEVSSDHMVDFDGSCNSELGSSRMEERCKEVEEQCLALDLEIRNKDMELEAIKGKISVLESEKVGIEEEVRVLREKKAVFVGRGVNQAVGVGIPFEGRGVEVECEEVSMLDQLMIENNVLECEKSFMVKELEEWKRKCVELESRMCELEGRLNCQGKEGVLSGTREATQDLNEVGGSRNLGTGTCSPGAIDGRIHMEGSMSGASCTGTSVKRQLAFGKETRCDEKIAPPTPAGARPSSAAVIDIIDSDNEPDVPTKRGPGFQSEVTPSMIRGVCFSDIFGSTDEEDEGGSKDFLRTPKRKRDFHVVNSDDEQERHELMPKKRVCKIDTSDNECEDDDETLPINQILNRAKSEYLSEDDDDNTPISQLKMNRARISSTPAGLRMGRSSSQKSDNPSDSLSRPRRRLVKSGERKPRDRTQEMSTFSDSRTNENVEDGESEEDDSGSDASLGSFIVNDSDVEDLEDDSSEDGTDHPYEPEEASDDNLSFHEIISRFQSRKDPNAKWVLQGDMLSDFGKDPELCMRNVCALYRRQITKENHWEKGIFHIGQGFNKYDAPRGNTLGDYLTGGDADGDLVKTVEELESHDPEGPEVCCKLAKRYSNQLFEIYESSEDPFFPSVR